jgi:hypothetical protein
MTQISKDGQHVGGSEVVRLGPCFRVLFGHWVGQLLLSLGFLLEMHAPRVMRVSLSGKRKSLCCFETNGCQYRDFGCYWPFGR